MDKNTEENNAVTLLNYCTCSTGELSWQIKVELKLMSNKTM